MGNGISRNAKQVMFTITGLIQLTLYIIFLVSPADQIMKKGWWGILMVAALLISFGISMSAAILTTSDCDGDSCNDLPLKIIMGTCSGVAAIVIFILLYTEFLESTKIGIGFAAFGLIILTLFYAAFAIDFRGVLCMCICAQGVTPQTCDTLSQCTCFTE